MLKFRYNMLISEVTETFKDDLEGLHLFFGMLVCCEHKSFPPTTTLEKFKKVVETVGPKFIYVTREDEQNKRDGTAMMLCFLPYDGETEKGRIYMLPVNDLKLHRAVVLGGEL